MSPSTLEAAKLSLREAERLEGEAERAAREGRGAKSLRREARDELLYANAQASIAIAEILSGAEEELPEPQAQPSDFGGEPTQPVVVHRYSLNTCAVAPLRPLVSIDIVHDAVRKVLRERETDPAYAGSA